MPGIAATSPHLKSAASLGFDPRETNLRQWLSSWPNMLRQLDAINTGLRRRQVTGPFNCAKCTVEFLRAVIGTCKWSNARQLMSVIKEIGRELIAAKPTELAVGNMVRRVLYIIREEHTSLAKATQAKADADMETAAGAGGEGGDLTGLSLESMLGGVTGPAVDYSQPFPELKANIIEGLTELRDDLESSNDAICDYAAQTIHANEVVLTIGYSSTVEAFLKAAAHHYAKLGLTFHVIVAEAAPSLHGHRLAKSLAQGDKTQPSVEVTVIPDSAVFALMARVNKVIMPTHAVVANGGLIATSGCHMVALSAKELSVPVVCVTGLYKLCPLFPHDQDTFNCLLAPLNVMSHDEYDAMKTVEVVNPAYDYIPPELVDLYITNVGGHQPSYIYRLLSEYYHRDDHILEKSGANDAE